MLLSKNRSLTISIQAILFDLDGTLQDTAIELAEAINQIRAEDHLAPVDYTTFRHAVHGGATSMIAAGFNVQPTHPAFPELKTRLLHRYQQLVGTTAPLFEGIPQLLDYIEFNSIPWGVVTSKSMRFAIPALAAYGFHQRLQCLVAGDSVQYPKPAPDPLLQACDVLNVNPRDALYIGDNEVDVLASKAAGMQHIIVTYGYYDRNTHPQRWDADLLVHHPQQIIEWLKTQ